MKTALMIALVLAAAANLAHADLILSGDSNIGNGINGSSGSAVVAGNGTFFSNLLGGGSTVVFRTTTNGDSTETTSQSAIIGYYTGLGKTVNTVSAATSANLAGANLFIGFLPDVAFSPTELSAIQSFLTSGGGRVLLTGEFSPFDPTADTNINALLAFLGNPMSLGFTEIDAGFHTATGGQIAATPYSAGVTAFEYAATTNVVSGGTTIFRTTTAVPFVSYTSTSAAVPEPSSIVLAISFLAIVGLKMRRNTAV